jgi:hypothetical protein
MGGENDWLVIYCLNGNYCISVRIGERLGTTVTEMAQPVRAKPGSETRGVRDASVKANSQGFLKQINQFSLAISVSIHPFLHFALSKNIFWSSLGRSGFLYSLRP